jgi:inner membrane protein
VRDLPPAEGPGGVLESLARFFSRREICLALIAAIAVIDLAIPWHQLGFLPRGLVDEPCHLATAGIVLGAITRLRGSPPSRHFGWAMLAFSVLIDLDHLPLEFGSPILTAGTPRPYTHALWVVVMLAAAAAAVGYRSWRTGTSTARIVAATLAGGACGVAVHFLRDVATAPISLWWPVSNAAVQVPYGWYLVPLQATFARATTRRSRSS